MHFNIGLIFSILQDHRRSVAAFKKSLEMDPFFAVACFQRGVSHFALGDLDKAYEDFDQAYIKLRGNPIINYHQLGLPFRLYECEVLFNRGICQLYLGRIDAGLTDLYFAQKAKLTEEHEIIDQAVRDRGRNYSVYSIPPGVLFRPSETKMEKLRQFQMEYNNQGGDTDSGYFSGGGGGKRQNSVLLLPPSVPWMQEVARTDATYLAVVPQPQRPQQPVVPQVLEQQQQQRPPSPEEPDPFMFDPVQFQQQQPPPPPPAIQTPTEQKKKTYDPENTWKVVDRRATLKKDEPPARRLHRPTTPPTTTMMMSPVASSDRSNNNAFPIPAAQDNQADYTGTLDTMSYYGDDLDEELDRVYASLNAYLTTNSKSNSKRNGEEVPPPPPPAVAAAVAPIASSPLAPPPSSHSHPKSNNSKPKKKNIYKYISQQPASPDAKIKIKVHYQDTRILLVPSDIMFTELLTRVRAKFNVAASSSQDLRLQYKDEENVMVLMIDQDDLNMARYLSRSRNAAATSKHPMLEKLELWCISASSSI